MAKLNDIAMRCPVCFRTQDSKAEFLEHLQSYQHQYSKAAAQRTYKKAYAEAVEEQRSEALLALGWDTCPSCKQVSDPNTWASPIITHNRDKRVCMDCQPHKVIDTVGAIFKARWETGHFDYCLWDSDYSQGSYPSIVEAERALRRHVGDCYDRMDVVLDERDRKEIEHLNRLRDRVREIMQQGHDWNEANHLQSGFKVCKEHEICAYRQLA